MFMYIPRCHVDVAGRQIHCARLGRSKAPRAGVTVCHPCVSAAHSVVPLGGRRRGEGMHVVVVVVVVGRGARSCG